MHNKTQETHREEKWYDRYVKKAEKAKAKAKAINERREANKKRNEYFSEKRKNPGKFQNTQNESPIPTKPNATFVSQANMFDFSYLPEDATKVLENFDSILQDVRPLNARQLENLPDDIRELSRQLTDERNTRRMGYMNSTEELSAYIRYFMWWNLVRFTRVFASQKESDFDLKDGDYCLDLGSGPLTVVIALWLSRPELRNKRLTFYCVDLSLSTLSLGEDIYLSVASRTPPSNERANPTWNIIRIKGSVGVPIKNKAAFISAANMFNEIRESVQQRPVDLADEHIKTLLNYATENASMFIAEPGMPVAAYFVSLMRIRFLQNKFTVFSPCTHEKRCPMSGLHARYGGSAKWCNFSFQTKDAPKRLLQLSKDAGLPKERAVISFVFAGRRRKMQRTEKTLPKSNELILRIASDPLWLPGNRQGFYACSAIGLVLLVNLSHVHISSGEQITVVLNNKDPLPRDLKSKAGIIVI